MGWEMRGSGKIGGGGKAYRVFVPDKDLPPEVRAVKAAKPHAELIAEARAMAFEVDEGKSLAGEVNPIADLFTRLADALEGK
jgi:hypothetical protein